MKEKTPVVLEAEKRAAEPAAVNRLESAVESTAVKPHRLTRDGVKLDSLAAVDQSTDVPDMTEPIVDKPKSRLESAETELPGARSHEMNALIGRAVRLELKKKHEIHSVAFISNKGGVGKTHISSNMAFNLSRADRTALLIDLDLGNCDVTNKLGFYCDTTIVDLLKGKRNVNQLIYNTPHGFDVIAGESGNFKLANLNALEKRRLIRAFRDIGRDYDFVLYDLSAGIGQTTLDFALAQDYQIIVTTPQDIIAGYSCIKAAYYRFQQLEKMMAEQEPGYKPRKTFRPFVVLNQVSDFDTGKMLFDRINHVAKQNLGGNKAFSLDVNFLGVITSDPQRIRESELDRFLYSNKYGASKTGQCFSFLVDNLINYRDPESMTFTNKLKRFVDIFIKSVEETKYAK